jgi:alkylation response protein AidB-like acyl-CoA dehydrogenase
VDQTLNTSRTLSRSRVVDFSYTPEEEAFRDELRAWIAAQLPFPPLPHNDDERVEFLSEWQRRLVDAGWAAISFPVEDGGRGLGPVCEAIVLDELGSAGLPTAWHYGYVARVTALSSAGRDTNESH